MAVLLDDQKLVLLSDSDHIDPIGILQDVIMIIDPSIRKFTGISAQCSPRLFTDICRG